MAETPRGHNVRIFTVEPTGTRAGLDALFDALDAEGLAPTHQGRDERAKAAFVRKTVTTKATATAPTSLTLIRRKAPTYVAGVDVRTEGLAAITIELGAVKDPELPYRLGETLAAAFHAVHALVHPVFAGRGALNAAGKLEPQWLQAFGPSEVAARTWYGAHLTKLIGVARLEQAGEVVKAPWGGVRLDLAPSPWTLDADALAARSTEATAALAASGAFGDYRDFYAMKAGPKWKPIPEAA